METYKIDAEKESNRHLIRLSALEQEVILLILLFHYCALDGRVLTTKMTMFICMDSGF